VKETEAFRVLASADRQLLLYELARAERALSEKELARRIAAQRHQTAPDKISEDEISRAHVRLIHVHLPWLRDLDIVEQSEGEVALTDHEHTRQLFEAAESLGDWPADDLPGDVDS